MQTPSHPVAVRVRIAGGFLAGGLVNTLPLGAALLALARGKGDGFSSTCLLCGGAQWLSTVDELSDVRRSPVGAEFVDQA